MSEVVFENDYGATIRGRLKCSICGDPMELSLEAGWLPVCENGHQAFEEYDGQSCVAKVVDMTLISHSPVSFTYDLGDEEGWVGPYGPAAAKVNVTGNGDRLEGDGE